MPTPYSHVFLSSPAEHADELAALLGPTVKVEPVPVETVVRLSATEDWILLRASAQEALDRIFGRERRERTRFLD